VDDASETVEIHPLLRGYLRERSGSDARARIESIGRILVLTAAEDEDTAPLAARHLSDLIPGCSLAVVGGAVEVADRISRRGHLVLAEQIARCAHDELAARVGEHQTDSAAKSLVRAYAWAGITLGWILHQQLRNAEGRSTMLAQ